MVVGVTLADPVGGKLPNPGMFTEVALLVVQLSTAVAPLAMLFGLALNEIVGRGFEVTVIVVVDAADPPGPVAVAV